MTSSKDYKAGAGCPESLSDVTRLNDDRSRPREDEGEGNLANVHAPSPSPTQTDNYSAAFDTWCREYFGMSPHEVRFSDKNKPLIVGDILAAFIGGRLSVATAVEQDALWAVIQEVEEYLGTGRKFLCSDHPLVLAMNRLDKAAESLARPVTVDDGLCPHGKYICTKCSGIGSAK